MLLATGGGGVSPELWYRVQGAPELWYREQGAPGGARSLVQGVQGTGYRVQRVPATNCHHPVSCHHHRSHICAAFFGGKHISGTDSVQQHETGRVQRKSLRCETSLIIEAQHSVSALFREKAFPHLEPLTGGPLVPEQPQPYGVFKLSSVRFSLSGLKMSSSSPSSSSL